MSDKIRNGACTGWSIASVSSWSCFAHNLRDALKVGSRIA
jgi:hypothetical protein